MKKFLAYFILILSLLFIFVYALAFTTWGNSTVSGIIENKINEKDVIVFKFEKFVLSATEIDIKANIDSNSVISVNGKYNMFDMGINLMYNLDIKDLSKLQKFTNRPLNGPLKINGLAIGNKELLTVKGTSNIFDSNTRYLVKLINFEPSTVNVKVIKANVEKALYTLNEPLFTKAYVDVLINIKNAQINELDGDIKIKVYEGKLSNKAINKEFNLKLKDVLSYKSTINAKLLKDTITSDLTINTSLFDFFVKEAKINVKDLSFDSDYKLDIGDLSKLNDLAQMKLKGSFYFKGNVKKVEDIISFNTNSNIFKSDTKISGKMISSKIQDIEIDIKKLSLHEALKTISQPSYAKAYIDINGEIADISKLEGKINTRIYSGLVNNASVNKNFDLKLKDKFTFKADIESVLKDNTIFNKSNIYTSKANIFAKETKIDLKSMKILSDYKIDVKDLSKLYDLSNTKMRGSLSINGSIVKDENLLVLGNSKLLDGSLEYKLLNDDFTAKIKNLNVLKAMHMMYYPEILSSRANMDIKYNLLEKQGEINGLLSDGRFVKNKFSSMLNNLARFDITKEVYEKITLNSKINKNIINSKMYFKSKLTKLDMNKSILNTDKMTTDSYIKVNIKGLKFDTSIKGSINSPKIKLHTNSLIKNQLKDKLKAKKEKLLKELKIDKNLEDKLKNTFKSFF